MCPLKHFHLAREINEEHVFGFLTKAINFKLHGTWKCVISLNSHQKTLRRFLKSQSAENSNQKVLHHFLGVPEFKKEKYIKSKLSHYCHLSS
jgi:hypothetical protein